MRSARLTQVGTLWPVAMLYIVLLIQVTDSSIANVSFVTIARDMHVRDVDGQWVVTAFGVGVALAIALSVSLSSWAGNKTLLGYGILSSLIAGACCGFGQSLAEIILLRGVQGVGCGLILMGGQLLMNELLGPDRRPLSLGLWTSAMALAPVIGPFIASLILFNLAWRWLFWIPVIPLAAGAIVLRHRLSFKAERGGSFPSLIAPLLLLVILVTSSQIVAPNADGTLPPLQTRWHMGAAMIAAWIALTVYGRVRSTTLFQWSLFRNRTYSTYISVVVVVNGLLGGITVVYAVWLQKSYGLAVPAVAAVLASGGLIASSLGLVVGSLKRRSLFPAFVVGSLVLFAGSCAITACLTKNSPFLMLVVPRLVFGFALAMFSPVSFLAVSELPERDFLPAHCLGMFLRPAIANVFIVASVSSLGASDSAAKVLGQSLNFGAYFSATSLVFVALAAVVFNCTMRQVAERRTSPQSTAFR
jgi:DHA2 family multidrug resistance protein